MRKRTLAVGLTFGTWIVAACGGGGASDTNEPDDDAGSVESAPKDASLPPTADASSPPSDGAAPLLDSSTATDATADGANVTDAADAGGLDLSSQDILFFAFGDPQYGGGPADKNSFHIQALNGAAALMWPTDAGFESTGPVGDPRAVVIAGDLTQNGQAGRDPFEEWYTTDPQGGHSVFNMNTEYGIDAGPVPQIAAELGLFANDYGLRGNDGRNPYVLKYRVFEGYGNHDFDTLAPDPGADPVFYNDNGVPVAPARDMVSIRNQVRASWPEMRNFAPGNAGHYSWDWDQTHFVHLNLVASDAIAVNTQDDGGTQPPRDPQGALTFLIQDLAAQVGSSCRPVIIIMHYGFDPFSEEGRWWDDTQRLAFLQAVRPYNIAAILHGHVHETCAYTMEDEQGKSYDVFSLGSPYYEGQATNNGRGHFNVFRIKGKHIDAADISWLPQYEDASVTTEYDGEDLWTNKSLVDLSFQITTIYGGGWGGWSYSKDIDVASCQAGYPLPDAGVPACPPGATPITDAGANLLVEQPNPNLGENADFAFNWDDSWGEALDSTPDQAFAHMTSAAVCGQPATHWQEDGIPVGAWIKFLPENTNQPDEELYFLASPLVAGNQYIATITLFGTGAYHLNIFDGSGGFGIGDNAGTSVTLDGVHATTLTVPFTMGTGTPEFQVRVNAQSGGGGAGTADVDVTMWGAGIYAN